MHPSSYETMRAFVRVHLAAVRDQPLEILDFGSQMVEGQQDSYRGLLDDPQWRYRGLDIEPGLNVDVVVDDAYAWHLPSDSVDLVISGQAFEHVEFFWASMFEIVRVLRPGGVAAIIAPSGGVEHRFPVDCWRFYRDGFAALATYVGCDLVDVFTDWGHGQWADTILVARKPLWDAEGRRRFHERAAMQRVLLAADGAAAATTGDPESELPAPSILASVVPGALTTELEAMRDERLRSEAAAHAAAVAAQQAELDARIAAEADRIAAERLDGITPLRWYGRARAGVAKIVGATGRDTYRRLRGRA